MVTILFLSILLFSSKVQSQSAGEMALTIGGEVPRPLSLTVKELSRLPPAEIMVKDKDGNNHVYKGVRLVDLLDSAGVTLGGELRGENLAKYILVKAADGYKVIFSLPEVDPEFTDQTIVLAYQVDGKPLPKGQGPFRMVVPNDKKQARWIREMTAIEVVFSKE